MKEAVSKSCGILSQERGHFQKKSVTVGTVVVLSPQQMLRNRLVKRYLANHRMNKVGKDL